MIGQDPSFPYLDASVRFSFPAPQADNDIVAIGGNLSPGMLLSAYEQGIFPWYGPYDPILWQSPNPRMVIFPEDLHISSSMRKILEKNKFKIEINKNFEEIISGCQKISRKDQDGTWINSDIIKAYSKLYDLKFISCAASYFEGKLVGGCYGVKIGRMFAGESMFALMANASKAAFLSLALMLFEEGTAFIDCQVPSLHLSSLGGRIISQGEFLSFLKNALS